MTTLQTEANPFALMMEPEAIFAAIASSERLARLKSRICRPLDKPLINKAEGEDAGEDEGEASGYAEGSSEFVGRE